MPSIPLTGLGANDPVPGQYAEINFAQGPASGSQGIRGILLVGNKSTAGDATLDTVVYSQTSTSPLASLQDCINRFGQGSELHRMWRRVTAVNTVTPISAIAVTASVGAAATGVITITVTATAAGTVRTWVGDDFVDSPITSGDTVTTVAAAISSAVNSKLDWPVTASPAAGVVTLTAKVNGLRGNQNRFQAIVMGTGVGTTSSASAVAFMSGGTTADSNATALTTILASRYYYIVSAAEDATQVGALLSQVNSQASPVTGIRQRVFAGSLDTPGNVNTIATGLNGARAEVIWMQQSDATPAELAANNAAIYALEEASTVPRCNFSGYGNDSTTSGRWKIKAPRSGNQPTRAQILTALQNGVTPIAVNSNSTTYLVKRITTRSLSGSNPDYRIRDAHKVTICDFFTDDLLAKQALQFAGKLIGDDPLPGQRVPGPNVVTPRVSKACIWKLVDDYASNDLLQNPDTIKSGTISNRETSPTTRMSNRVPLQTIDILDQVTSAIDQTFLLALGLGLASILGHFIGA